MTTETTETRQDATTADLDDAQAQTHTDPQNEPQTPENGTESGTEEPNPNREAARWRTKLRETETERDQLQERITALQRQDAIRQATGPGLLIDGEDLFRSAELADLLDDDGNTDPELITAAVAELVESKPHLGAKRITGDVGAGQRKPSTGTSWADVIKG